jgi:two-component system, cell cycle sensor histidine kinase and response regulator CckA
MGDPPTDPAQERQALLAQLTALFASGGDLAATLQGVVNLLAPGRAAWASIDVIEGSARRRVALASVEIPGHTDALRELHEALAQWRPTHGTPLAGDSTTLVTIDTVDDSPWPPRTPEQEALYRVLLPMSLLYAPMRAHGEECGALQLVTINGAPPFAEDDARLVADAAQRAAIAVYTNRLVEQLQRELGLRTEAARRLEASEARYRRIFEGSPFPLWIFDDETERFLAVNSAAIAQYGYSAEEFARMTIADIRPPEELGKLRRARQQRERDAVFFGVFRHRRKDGSDVTVEVRSHAVEFDGRRARLVQALDVTERTRAFEALRAAKERHQLLSRVTNEVIWEWDTASGHHEVNEAFHSLFRYRPEAVGTDFEWFRARVHPDDDAVGVRAIEDAVRDGKETLVRRYRFRRGDDTWALVEDRAVIAHHPDGGARVIGSFTDISEAQSLSEQLATAQRMEAVGRLAGGVAHDFNNLLTAMRGFAQFALDEQLPSSPARDDIEQILLATDRAASLTRQLLAFSRRQVLQPHVVNVNDVLTNLQKILSRVLGEDVEVQFFLDPALAPVVVDPGQLEQVIMNLVVNARDAMPEGGLLTIETTNARIDDAFAASHFEAVPGDYVRISISDTGIGMSAEVMARIFEPFFSTKDRDRGTGLGLATSYGIIRQSGGYIGVYSEPGRGTAFKVLLPRAAADDATVTPAPPEPSSRLQGDETILVIEDDDRVRRVSTGALLRSGFRVLEARTAEVARTLFREHHREIDLVVSDVVLPRMNGPALVRELQAIRADIPVLYVSGYTENALQHIGSLDARVQLLEKPFAPDALVRRVRAILDLRPGAP